MDLVGLSDRMSHRPGATLRRATTARRHRTGDGHRPELIVADEPTGDLDTKSANEVLT